MDMGKGKLAGEPTIPSTVSVKHSDQGKGQAKAESNKEMKMHAIKRRMDAAFRQAC